MSRPQNLNLQRKPGHRSDYRDGFGVGLLGLAAIALVGQLLAGKSLSSKANQTV